MIYARLTYNLVLFVCRVCERKKKQVKRCSAALESSAVSVCAAFLFSFLLALLGFYYFIEKEGERERGCEVKNITFL